METLARAFLRVAKRRWSAFCMADSTGRELTYGRALTAALLLADRLGGRARRQQAIGILLPASVAGALANIGASLAGAIPVNLNFTAGADAMGAAIDRCEIDTIVTSRTFLSKAGLAATPQMIFIEDLLGNAPAISRLRAAAVARTLPLGAVEQRFVHEGGPDSVATVVFSSGSTGMPKGVMLSHRNIGANIQSAREVFALTDADVMLGVLPFFHAFGFTGTLWLPLVAGFGVVYHANPMDAKTIGELAEQYRATLLISTPTFCLSYLRKIPPPQFSTLRYAIVGAERLREPIANAFKDRFGMELLEGYGCTEMAPIVAVNHPDPRPGSVGRPLPGVRAKVVDIFNGEGPLINREGLLLVDGPNKMLGYLGEPDLTQAVSRDGWYVTGDIATIDGDGYIRITDRLSRFSKIGGEMVPHMKVEEHIQALLNEPHQCVVTAVPDPVRGERLVAFYTDPDLGAADLWQRLGDTPLPKLWTPKREDVRFIESIPTLGTGKIDLRAVRSLVLPADDAQQQTVPGGREKRLEDHVGDEAGAGSRGERTRRP